MAQSRVRRRKSRVKRTLKIFVFIGLFSFLLAGAAVTYFAFQLANATTSSEVELERGEKSELRTEPVNPSKDNISILFLGLDDREGNLEGRTDAMLLATFNKELGSIKLLNIPRDSLVDIPGRKNRDKINHAHAYGGLDTTIDTVENLFDIPVDYYVTLNFVAFVEIVDALGGVEVEVPFTFTEMDSNDTHGAITLEEGTQLLDGEEALAFSRMRKSDPRGDFGRGERQQEVIKAVIRKGASFSSISSYNEVLQSIEDHISTNLSFGNIVALHSYASELNNMDSIHIEGDDRRINGGYYFEPRQDSIDELSATFRVHLGLVEPEERDYDEFDSTEEETE
ncbi:transcriptional regulator [Alkalihalophilus pseudofirmus]|uniref:LCP family protein n=1 Tax=Alkalihalophilus pseudofirmus TaxID=79885 RepID=UPI000950F3F7|nr:transcriptional regulator [Alkalihalophilus pseudofirmus]